MQSAGDRWHLFRAFRDLAAFARFGRHRFRIERLMVEASIIPKVARNRKRELFGEAGGWRWNHFDCASPAATSRVTRGA
ncbi:MAG: hypothetical protein C4334_11085 [Pyrinomonas sp.]